MHPLLEKDHQQLIDLLEVLDNCVTDGQAKNQVHKYLEDFATLAKEHFKNEERIMETYKYTDFINHKNEHTSLLEQLYSLKSKLRAGHTPFGSEYMKLLRNWLENHLLDTDNKLEEFLYEVNA